MSGPLATWAGRPVFDWAPAVVVGFVAAWQLGETQVAADNIANAAVGGSALMGICAAVVTFVVSNLIGSSNSRVKQLEARSGSAVRRVWIGAIVRCLSLAVLCLACLIVAGYFLGLAVGLIAASLVFVLLSSLRSAYWLDLLWRAEAAEPVGLPDELTNRRRRIA